MSDPVKNIFRFVLCVFFQVYILNQIPALHRFITPYMYFLFLLWLPFYIKPGWLLLLGFVLGITVDYFTLTPGLHAAAATLVAFLRPFVINLFAPKEKGGFNYNEPSFKSMGPKAFSLYVLLLSFAHNFYLTLLEWLSFGSFWAFLIKIISTTAISVVLILVTDLLFPRKLKYRTNKA